MKKFILPILTFTIISLASAIHLDHAKSHSSHIPMQRSPAWIAFQKRLEASSIINGPEKSPLLSLPQSLKPFKNLKRISETTSPMTRGIQPLLVIQTPGKVLPRPEKVFLQLQQDEEDQEIEDDIQDEQNQETADDVVTVNNEEEDLGAETTGDDTSTSVASAADLTSTIEEEIEEGEELPPNKIRFCTDKQCPAATVDTTNATSETNETGTGETTSTTTTVETTTTTTTEAEAEAGQTQQTETSTEQEVIEETESEAQEESTETSETNPSETQETESTTTEEVEEGGEVIEEEAANVFLETKVRN